MSTALVIITLLATAAACTAVIVAINSDNQRAKAQKIAEENERAANRNAEILKNQIRATEVMEAANAQQIEEIKQVSTGNVDNNFDNSINILSNYSRRKSDRR